MRFIKIENNKPKDYTIDKMLTDYPDAVIYKKSQMPNEQLLAAYNVYPLITEPMPILGEDEAAQEGVPEFRDGEWHQTWSIRKLTEQEIQETIKNRESFLEIASVNGVEEFSSYLASQELQESRYEICKSCDSLTILKTCKECGCIMPLKVKLTNVTCPLGKW